MAGGSWDPNVDEIRSGLYVNFTSAAVAQVTAGPRGTVAIPQKIYSGGTASAKTVYEITGGEAQAAALFGSANIKSIKLILAGGANKIVAYTMPTYNAGTDAQDNIDMRAALDAYKFNVFCFDGPASKTEIDNVKTWIGSNRTLGKHYFGVFGSTAAEDTNPTTGNANSVRIRDDYTVNLIVGGKVGATTYNSEDYAPYIAGLIAGTPINKAITSTAVPLDDVTKRLTDAQIKTALAAGSLVLFNDGEERIVERGITTSLAKIRKIRARMLMIDDLVSTTKKYYIGKVDNNIDGQKALISSVKAYLEVLANQNVITNQITVALHPNYVSSGDKVYLKVTVVEVDSMEEIYLEISA